MTPGRFTWNQIIDELKQWEKLIREYEGLPAEKEDSVQGDLQAYIDQYIHKKAS